MQEVWLQQAKEEGCRTQVDVSMSIGSAGLEGFALSLGLILAIGPQNAFVMRQGLKRSHVFATCLACSLADVGLITAGILGVGALVSSIEGAEPLIAMGAAAFLAGYGVLRVKSSMNPEAIDIDGDAEGSLSATMAALLAITFLNPHVYFDTLLLIGSASTGFIGDERLAFGVGAALASFVFFFSLGYGAKRMSRVLNSPEAWRVIDRGIAVVMFVIAGAIIQPHL
ncbi:MAG: LysE/ArgO family amino acid transporter [Candidatus Thermoplasmatota archaeon]|nr:LysE/ArgO family amino acid transporter [Candidatus Thermoplasmatota archaeon]